MLTKAQKIKLILFTMFYGLRDGILNPLVFLINLPLKLFKKKIAYFEGYSSIIEKRIRYINKNNLRSITRLIKKIRSFKHG